MGNSVNDVLKELEEREKEAREMRRQGADWSYINSQLSTQSTGSVFNQLTRTRDPDTSTEQRGIAMETALIISRNLWGSWLSSTHRSLSPLLRLSNLDAAFLSNHHSFYPVEPAGRYLQHVEIPALYDLVTGNFQDALDVFEHV